MEPTSAEPTSAEPICAEPSLPEPTLPTPTSLKPTLPTHYSRTCLERRCPEKTWGGIVLSSSEGRSVGLEGGSHLLQAFKRQIFRVSKSILVAVPMDAAIGHPAGPTFVAVGTQRALLSHEAERVERCQPCKPLRRIRCDVQLSLLGADEYIPASGSIFNKRDQTGLLPGGMASQRRHGLLQRHRTY